MDKTDVVVEIKSKIEIKGYILQYSTNETNWINYTGAITFQNNDFLWVRLISQLEEVGGSIKEEITKIDKVEPDEFKPTATSTSDTITLTGSTTDGTQTEVNGCSGIEKYYFSKDNGKTWEPTEGQEETSYTFNDLPSDTTYQLKMKAVDKAGNERESSSISQKTIKLSSDLKEGEYVNYEDKNGTTRTCIVLYDSKSEYNLQIITADIVKEVEIGNGTGSDRGG